SVVGEKMRRTRTRERRQGHALRESEECYHRLFEDDLSGDYISTPEGRILLCNPAFAEMFGFSSAQEAIGTSILDLYPDPGEREPLLERLKQEGKIGHFGVWRKRRDGEPIHIVENLVGHFNDQGQLYEIKGYLFEDTDRKRAEEALREARDELEIRVQERTVELRKTMDLVQAERQRFQNLLDQLPAYLVLLSPDFRVPFANRFFEQRFGKCEGRRCYEYLFQRPEPCENCKAYNVLETNVPQHWEWIGPDGRDYEIYDFPFTDADGSPLIMEVGLDITERKNAEAELQRLNDELKRRTVELKHRARQLQKLTLDMSEAEDRERKRLAEILHDDLQQVLASAKFHLSLMRNGVRDDPALHDVGDQIDQMLRDAIAKSRSLSHELSPAVLHHDNFEETLEWLANQVQAKHGLVVHVHTHDQVSVESETTKAFLYKVTQELLFNVVKHARVNEARIQVRRLGRCIYLSISDQGRGFDPEELGQTAGFGLLSIHERIELLGGCMKIKSAKDKGSMFLIAVPDGEVEPELTGRAPSADTDRLRVLLADDHEIVREGLALLLNEESAVEVIGGAPNGLEAVDLADRLKPHVVIMYVSMPLMSGDEATRRIKQHLPSTRVVALSMSEDPDTVKRMHAAGAEAYVLKTAPSEELLAAIRG
ncbi:MAG: response regulator, partial [Planctomycetaceae bacterium]